MKRASVGKLVVCCVGTLVLGVLSGVLSGTDREWYEILQSPPGTPPGWVFGPVWTVLYLMMGVSLFLLWQRASEGTRARPALVAYFLQFALNLAWSPVFFGAHRIGTALVVIVALWLMIFLTILLARRVSRPAAWLLVPYFTWVSYATYLNVGFYLFNRA
jgi:tryptophan-rich sensory protein